MKNEVNNQSGVPTPFDWSKTIAVPNPYPVHQTTAEIKYPLTPIPTPASEPESLCTEHGFRNCGVCDEKGGLLVPNDDGFREWLDEHESGMEGEDDVEALMHVAWKAALLRNHKAMLTAKEWRDNAFETAASVAERYGENYAAGDIRALKSNPAPTPPSTEESGEPLCEDCGEPLDTSKSDWVCKHGPNECYDPNYVAPPKPETPDYLRGKLEGSGAFLIQEERQRQMDVEGWTPKHDDEHSRGEMMSAAMDYVAECKRLLRGHDRSIEEEKTGLPWGWPWEASWWKPSPDPIRNLVKAGALIAAEIDRLKRGNS